jgi:hypothetical protein
MFPMTETFLEAFIAARPALATEPPTDENEEYEAL